MKTIDLRICLLDLLPDKKDEDGNPVPSATTKEMDRMVLRYIESAVISFHKGDDVGAASQRKIDRILDAVESAYDNADGKLSIKDELFADLQSMWEGRHFKAVGGAERKMIQRIDRRICPDAYKGDSAEEN